MAPSRQASLLAAGLGVNMGETAGMAGLALRDAVPVLTVTPVHAGAAGDTPAQTPLSTVVTPTTRENTLTNQYEDLGALEERRMRKVRSASCPDRCLDPIIQDMLSSRYVSFPDTWRGADVVGM